MNEIPAAGWTAIGVIVTALCFLAGHLLTRRSKVDEIQLAAWQASSERTDADLKRFSSDLSSLRAEVKELRTELHGIRRLFRAALDYVHRLRAQLTGGGIEPEPAPDELADSL